jgi:hypothetical protein
VRSVIFLKKQILKCAIVTCFLTFFYHQCLGQSQSLNNEALIKVDYYIEKKEYFNAIFKIDSLFIFQKTTSDLLYLSDRQLFCYSKLKYELDFENRLHFTLKHLTHSDKRSLSYEKFLITAANGYLNFNKFKKARQLLKKVKISKIKDINDLELYNITFALLSDRNNHENSLLRHMYGHSVSEGLHEKGFQYISNLTNVPKSSKIRILETYTAEKVTLFRSIDPDLDAFIGEDFWNALFKCIDIVKGPAFDNKMLYYFYRGEYELRKGNTSISQYFFSLIYKMNFDSFTAYENQLFKKNSSKEVQISFLYNKLKNGLPFEKSDLEIFTILAMNHPMIRAIPDRYDSLIKIAIFFLDNINKYETEKYQLAINSAKLLLYFSEYGYDSGNNFTSLPSYNSIHLSLVNYLIEEQQIWCHNIKTLENLFELKSQIYNQMPNKTIDEKKKYNPFDSAIYYAMWAINNHKNTTKYSELNRLNILNDACINSLIYNRLTGNDTAFNEYIQQYLKNEIIRNTGIAYYTCLFKFRSEFTHRVTRDIWDRNFFSSSTNLISKDLQRVDTSLRNSLERGGYYNSTMSWLLSTNNVSTYLLSDIFNPSKHLKSYYNYRTFEKVDASTFKKEYIEFIDSQIIKWTTDQNIQNADKLANHLRANPIFRNYHNHQLYLKWEDIQNNLLPNESVIYVLPNQFDNFIRFQILFFDNVSKYVNTYFTRFYDYDVCFNPKSIGSIYRDTGDLCLYQIMEKIGHNHSKNYVLYSGQASNINYQIIGKFNRPRADAIIQYNLTTCEHTKSIKDQVTPKYSTINSALFIGDLDYSSAKFQSSSESSESYVITRGNRSSQKGMAWERLPATKTEIENCNSIIQCPVKKIFQGNNIYTDSIAKWTASNKNYILHIATHGYNTISKIEVNSNTFFSAFSNENSNYQLHPLLETGIALSNANIGERNSICAAIDIIKMNLSQCQLCVLSACNSGTTKITIDGQNHGLKRALKIAGVKNIITSLWSVPDEETSIFFTTFYKNLNIYNNIQIAFTETQHELSKIYDFYYWGAFILDNFQTKPILF